MLIETYVCSQGELFLLPAMKRANDQKPHQLDIDFDDQIYLIIATS